MAEVGIGEDYQPEEKINGFLFYLFFFNLINLASYILVGKCGKMWKTMYDFLSNSATR
jgi:hypothetical protein